MRQFDQEHIAMEQFDREYLIEELLPPDLLDNVARDLTAMLPDRWALYSENGRAYYQSGQWQQAQVEKSTALIQKNRPQEEMTIHGPDNCRIVLLPVEYDLEVKGYLALCHARPADEAALQSSKSVLNMFKQFMRLKHQTMLTSGLHGMVVEESYAELKSKAQALALSEEKYRNLSANLEIEVQRKTEEIHVAQTHMMQQEKMAAIGQLSAGMAHEINNPLGFMISNLTTLKSYAADLDMLVQNYQQLASLCNSLPEVEATSVIQSRCMSIQEVERNLDSAFLLADIPVLVQESIDGAERIQKIVRDLRTVARPGESKRESINIHESIDAVLTIVQNRIGPNIAIQRAFSPVPLVPGYPQEVNQIWLNLILNALDAMDDEGILGITTQAANHQAVVLISDTGNGIAPNKLSKIFDPFFTTKDVGRGTGLGLHLVYQLVLKHGGRIEVRSEPGKGSAFTVRLPTAKDN